jgi:hypothetical protein
MFEDGLLDGRVAVAWDQTEQDVADDIALPALAAHDVELVRTLSRARREAMRSRGERVAETQ